MFLTISTTGTPERPATDLGFLLHKHPGKAQAFSTSYGRAHVFYPEATDERCTAALLLEVDPLALVRRGKGGKGRGGAPDAALAQYVNDRPYAASSLLAVALSAVFSSALRGTCKALPERAGRPLPLRVEVPALPARGGPDLVRALFEPLGWTARVEPVPLDERFPDWGDSRYVRLVLDAPDGTLTLSEALRHLYVLLPVLDDAKHYWVSADEVDKLLRAGEGWLADHPEQKLITSRYLSRRWSLTREAMERLELVRLADADDSDVTEIDNAVNEDVDTEEQPVPLAVRRREAVLAALEAAGAARVLDLGCGQGQLVQALLKDTRYTKVVGVDVSMRALTVAARRLKLDRMGERQAERVELFQGSLAYTDKRLKGYDAAVLSEVVEHVDLERLPALEHAVFGSARPRTVLVTTPNVEYNVRWESLPAGHARHGDHRFEWTRAQFRQWAGAVAVQHGYEVAFAPVGPDDPEVGPPTQMAVFTRDERPTRNDRNNDRNDRNDQNRTKEVTAA
ncbi:3' terminal RNA ribose 2'-O-methyltransferase Hen1 [Streptomyces spectabilis]|uniref:Small RNA 2'-O-methyltransferase n=1 Tax=Streptomyces spectabilis TaxID=68270 RepID=A0A5P2XJQ4_STRST|nr:3' terminal RNA ribose 2'-O-methyltransferase Hen1 [Streptomyces spectabilis]MBB5104976.1 3' terminal RNA ribose 2'-O-methyltransferase Hen1 [Streptomyces spectabilis]MCI3905708.1 3' terminal RNA ribose 2'-O-methyltransferase Hen1 [Streptomyces spectabilis]QEV62662.1 3' terminal RNA ribose 2'-O-methyltransferase Hen1 [Streptomyces spectabilis]GGV07052.1 3' terminal RNA ribose 2'-O-methyltransferase Hen1 [Streptomyces spectabilis]